MKVRELLAHIKEYQKDKDLGEDFLDWEIALEQHPDWKKCCNCNKPEDYIIEKDILNGGRVLYIKSHAIGCVRFIKHKVLGIQIHY